MVKRFIKSMCVIPTWEHSLVDSCHHPGGGCRNFPNCCFPIHTKSSTHHPGIVAVEIFRTAVSRFIPSPHPTIRVVAVEIFRTSVSRFIPNPHPTIRVVGVEIFRTAVSRIIVETILGVAAKYEIFLIFCNLFMRVGWNIFIFWAYISMVIGTAVTCL